LNLKKIKLIKIKQHKKKSAGHEHFTHTIVQRFLMQDVWKFRYLK